LFDAQRYQLSTPSSRVCLILLMFLGGFLLFIFNCEYF
jgi:hypothetical protein